MSVADDDFRRRYELLAELGRGGMGVVYRARDRENNNRIVAIKVLTPGLAGDAAAVARFEQEREVLLNLQYPHLVPIYHTGRVDGSMYIVMMLIDGGALDERLQQGPLAVNEAASVLDQLAQALAHVHASGFEHRDVKPANVLLSATARNNGAPFVYLTDFGIARLVGQASPMSKAGEVIGTFAYVAPERLVGKPSTTVADVYSLTCVLYEMLTGRAAFTGDDFVSISYAHVNAPRPKPTSVVPSLPVGLDDVIAKGTAVQPDQRYQTPAELVDATKAALAGAGASESDDRTTVVARTASPTTPLEETPPSRSRRRPALLVAALVAVAAVVAGVLLTLGSSSDDDTAGKSAAPSNSVPADRATAGTTAGTAEVTTPVTDPAGTATDAATAQTVGECLATAGNTVSCSATHVAEVYAVDTQCTQQRLLSYLGGTAGTDVLAASVSNRQRVVGGRTLCVVTAPSTSTVGTAAGVLNGPASAPWRRCVSGTGAPIGCDVAHKGEYVYSARTTATVDCDRQASVYLNLAPADFANYLVVNGNGNDADDTYACVAFVRGARNVLTTTVRNIGTGALPIESR